MNQSKVFYRQNGVPTRLWGLVSSNIPNDILTKPISLTLICGSNGKISTHPSVRDVEIKKYVKGKPTGEKTVKRIFNFVKITDENEIQRLLPLQCRYFKDWVNATPPTEAVLAERREKRNIRKAEKKAKLAAFKASLAKAKEDIITEQKTS